MTRPTTFIERQRRGFRATLQSLRPDVRFRSAAARLKRKKAATDPDPLGRTSGPGSDLPGSADLAEEMWARYRAKASDRGWFLSDLLALLAERPSFLDIRAERVAAGVLVEKGLYVLWAIDPSAPERPVRLSLSADGECVFQNVTSPHNEQPVYATGLPVGSFQSLELRADDALATMGPLTLRPLWDESGVRTTLKNDVVSLLASQAKANVRRELRTKLPDVMDRLDGRREMRHPSRVPPYARYLAGRLRPDLRLTGLQELANWIISDVFEDAGRRAMFCLTHEMLKALREPVFNSQVLKTDISLAVFAFWRRHYANVDIFSEQGLRTVQYKFATAPFVADKNNAQLIPDTMRRALSSPADPFRDRELPWSWFWLFLLEDRGQVELMKKAEFARSTSFKEVMQDAAVPARLSFTPDIWRAYWSSLGYADFTRFDLALVSILADVPVPELAVAERGAAYWRERLQEDVYGRAPRLKVLSSSDPPQAGAPALDLPVHDLVIIGHGNTTGLGRNLAMFTEALASLKPLVLSADDGSCLNTVPSYDPEIGVRARVVILCVNAHRAPEMIARFAPVCEGAHIIGFYVWETDRPPEAHAFGASVVDEIWTPTTYVADAYRTIATVPVHVVRKGLRPAPPRNRSLDRFRRSPEEFIFLTLADFGSSIVRKNPLDVIKAFQSAFGDEGSGDVRLVLKIRQITPGHWSNFDGYWEDIAERVAADPRITLLEGDLTDQEYWTLLATVDCLVSLHRSEGFGYAIADAMLAGKPVIVSDHSGPRDFCDATTSALVPVAEVPVPPEQLASTGFIGHWGAPDVAAAADAMRRAVEERASQSARVEAARTRILDDYGFASWSEAISARLKPHLEGRDASVAF